jgi:putative ABC transport system permease protein
MFHLSNDLRFAFRQLRRSPALAITATLTLALGIGANTAIFSLLDQALLRSLPVRNPQQLVVLEGTGEAWAGGTSSHGGDVSAYFSYPMYRNLDQQARTHGFEGLIATTPADLTIASRGTAQIARGEIVSGNYFSLLGTTPWRGRLLSQTDDGAPDANPVVVLSYSFWKNRLGGDPALVGQTISINGHPFQVVGIASPAFHSAVWGETPGLFLPMSMLDVAMPGQGKLLTSHRNRWMNILGRMAPGTTRMQAALAMASVWHALRADELKALGIKSPRFEKQFLTDSRLLVLPGASGFSYQRDELKKPLLVVMGMALLVLLIASVNVGSLLLVRSAGRVREFSLRSALGAGRTRLVQQLLLEGLVIGLLGGTVGLALAPLAVSVLVRQLAGLDDNTSFSASLDGRLLAFNFAVAVAVSLVFSLAPVMQLRRPNLALALRGTNSSAGGSNLVLRRAVVCLQIGLSVVLLVGAGLFIRTMQKLRAVDVGFNPSHLVTFTLSPKLAGYTQPRTSTLAQQVAQALATVPGVQAVGVSDQPVLTGDSHGGNITIEGYLPAPDESLEVQKTYFDQGYLKTMQIPVIAGRDFTAADTLSSPKVAIVNQAFARRYYGTAAKALGKRVMDGGSEKPVYDTEIVGVVPDYKEAGVPDEVEKSLFRPVPQYVEARGMGQLIFEVRSGLSKAQTIAAIRRSMLGIDGSLALDDLYSMDEIIEQNLANERLIELLAVAFGTLATILAGIGIYGVLAYATAQRTREIGIRIALGSSRSAISGLVLGDILRLAAIGVFFALPVAYGLGVLVRSELYGVSPTDPASILFAVLLISAVSLIAAAIPATRAASINPTEALRTE